MNHNKKFRLAMQLFGFILFILTIITERLGYISFESLATFWLVLIAIIGAVELPRRQQATKHSRKWTLYVAIISIVIALAVIFMTWGENYFLQLGSAGAAVITYSTYQIIRIYSLENL